MRFPLLRTLFCAATVALLPRVAISQALNAAVTARQAEVVALPAANTMSFVAISDTAWSRSLQQGTANRKDPFVAGLISFFIPGVGSMYAGNMKHGLIHLGIHVGAYALIVGSVADCINSTFVDDCSDNVGMASAGYLVLLGNDVWSIFTAVSDARAHNGEGKGRVVGSLYVNPGVRPLGVSMKGMTRSTGLQLLSVKF